ncbi:DUF2958 domain-containing protein [Candidatus Sulfurimonas baltica]|uniref:DUF2958 domain-containing protein n=1 Tax=Candidatus Sulfurimonas baltica TaxID=2740404 RepID=A0A7S7LT75_9BACT|nr:DUF2958 domain-containing protein [Candidatus Sulfurimonas baltica]QOY50920.1 DUF2958 domain-containing protein [Candidatus Sulfurimonas baltica]
MQLMTKELEKIIPAMYSSENTKLENKIVYAKFFTPDANWTWWVLEYDEEDRILFCMVHGLEKELGNVSLDELESVRGPLGLKIERDLHFTPTRYGDIKELR